MRVPRYTDLLVIGGKHGGLPSKDAQIVVRPQLEFKRAVGGARSSGQD